MTATIGHCPVRGLAKQGPLAYEHVEEAIRQEVEAGGVPPGLRPAATRRLSGASAMGSEAATPYLSACQHGPGVDCACSHTVWQRAVGQWLGAENRRSRQRQGG